MKSLNQWFSDLSPSDPALWLAVACGLSVMLVSLFVGRRSRRSADEVVALPASTFGDWDAPPVARHDERRRAIRRAGLPTPIHVVDSRYVKRSKPVEAYVLDRSTGGLRLALERPAGVGTTLLACPSNAPEGFDWVKLVVRNCREVGDYFEIGCQFDTELELNRLLMFG